MLESIFYHPDGTPRSYEERKKIRKAQEEGRMLAGIVTARARRDVQDVLAETTPEHLRRPMNRFAKLADALESSPRFKDEAMKRKILQYREEATAEDKRIDASMAQKAKQFALENDPDVKSAKEHCDRCLQSAEGADCEGWAIARGLLEAGATSEYWAEATRLTANARERISAKLNAHRTAVDATTRDYAASNAELARLDALRPTTADTHSS